MHRLDQSYHFITRVLVDVRRSISRCAYPRTQPLAAKACHAFVPPRRRFSGPLPFLTYWLPCHVHLASLSFSRWRAASALERQHEPRRDLVRVRLARNKRIRIPSPPAPGRARRDRPNPEPSNGTARGRAARDAYAVGVERKQRVRVLVSASGGPRRDVSSCDLWRGTRDGASEV